MADLIDSAELWADLMWNRGEVERAAHSLKGLVSNLHCRAVQDKAFEVEGLAHDRDKASIASAIATLSELTEQMTLKIEELRHSLAAQIAAS